MRTTQRISAPFGTILGAIALSAGLGLTAPARASDDPSGAIGQLSDADLKTFYVRCSRAAAQHALSGTEVALCSVGYQMLLDRSFGGDFLALLAWSRSVKDDADVVASSEPVGP